MGSDASPPAKLQVAQSITNELRRLAAQKVDNALRLYARQTQTIYGSESSAMVTKAEVTRAEAYELTHVAPTLAYQNEVTADILYARMRQKNGLINPTSGQIKDILAGRLNWDAPEQPFPTLQEIAVGIQLSQPRMLEEATITSAHTFLQYNTGTYEE